ncbi:NUDIX hydrolase [Candidatus Uhrbacteria bacterium]|nr:NUDIX hydrolase [Candidatus Uhrbacteria bacterium]
MQIIYAQEPLPDRVVKTLFLAGPTPRTAAVRSWRPEALRMLADRGYDGTVLCPEDRAIGGMHGDWDAQLEWERNAMERADCILFWVPRDLTVTRSILSGESVEDALCFPAFTTNIEFGRWEDSGKVVLGFPPNAPNTRYLGAYADRYRIPRADTLRDTIAHALAVVGDGADRTGGECTVPLHIWRTESFQTWYRAQVAARNRLDGARVVWTFRVGPNRSVVFFWALHADVYVASEDRNKTNEIVLARPDIATVVCFHRDPVRDYRDGNVLGNEVVLVREFRTPAMTADGFIREVPGGSSWKPTGDPAALAADELHEETGLAVDAARVRMIGTRQVSGTLSAHRAHVFAVELTEEELTWLRSQAGVAHGVMTDTEQTYVEVRTVGELLKDPLTDWANLGMIFAALCGE